MDIIDTYDHNSSASKSRHGPGLNLSLDLSSLLTWFKSLTASNLRKIAVAHRLVVASSATKASLTQTLVGHECDLPCQALCYVFASVQPRNLSSTIGKFGPLIVNTPVMIPCTFLSRSSRSEGQSLIPMTNVLLEPPFDPLRVLDRSTKAMIIKEWQSKTSTQALKPLACASCAICVTEPDSTLVHASAANLGLLCNNDLPEHLQPNDYDFHLYGRAILCAQAMENTHALGRLRICKRCWHALSNERMPKFALANWLYYGQCRLPVDVKEAFESSSMFDRMLIARARSNSICCRFAARENDLVVPGDEMRVRDILGNIRKGIRGNIIVSPLDTVKMNTVIPPGPTTIKDTMCTIFVGKDLPHRNTMHKYSPVLVRRSRVKLMIRFLLENNDHYKEDETFSFSPSNLDSLFESSVDEDLPSSVYVGTLEANDALAVSTSDYTERNADALGQECDELLMENVGYTDGDDTPANYRAMKTSALEHCLAGKPFVASGRGGTLIPDFNNPSIMTWLFPHLDPWGIGGFHHPNRKVPISMEEHLSHLLKLYNSSFQRDPEFAFVFFNVTRKALVSQGLRFAVPMHTHREVISNLLGLSPTVLEGLNKACTEDPLYRPTDDAERRAFKLLSSLAMVARHVPGSDGYKAMLRNEIRGLINRLGSPVLFITLNPSDVDNPIVRLLSGEDVDLEDITRGEDLSEWKRKILAAKNPAACALFFDHMVTKFIDIILRYGRKDAGAFGRCTAYYGTVEAQGKGTLHCHMLVWLEGHLPPELLRNELSANSEYKEKYVHWLESVVQCEFPLQTEVSTGAGGLYSTRTRAKDLGHPHPGTIPSPSIERYGHDSDTFWDLYYSSVESLLHEYNWHIHQHTCWKNLKRGEEKSDANCRMGMDGTTRPKTVLDEETSAVLLRRLHPFIASYNDLPTFLLRCNLNFQVICSGEAAKAFVYYVTDYITKNTIPTHVGMAAILHALQRTNAKLEDSLSLTDKQQIGAVTTAVNSMMGKLEISHQQVMSYLIGGGDHYTSHRFQVVHWGSICRFVESKLPDDDHSNDYTSESTPQNVGLTLGVQQIHATSQLLDFIYRGTAHEYEHLCLYEFFASTKKRKIGTDIDVQSSRPGFFSSWDHPQRATHEIHFARQDSVPVLLGPSIPNRRSSPAAEELWAKYMLILFKPWRDPTTLKDAGEAWLSAYSRYESFIDPPLRKIIDNMTVLSESKDARDAHASHRRHAEDQLEEMIAHPSPRPSVVDDANVEDDDDDDDDQCNSYTHTTSNVFQLLSNMESNPALTSRLLASYVDQQGGRNASHLLDMCTSSSGADGQLALVEGDATIMSTDDGAIIQKHSQIMKRAKKRLRSSEDSMDDEAGMPSRRRRRIDDAPIAERTVLQTTSISWKLKCSEHEAGLIASIIADFNLADNSEQLRAFKIIANKVLSTSQEQLLLYVSGVGGTGKSHVIKAIVALFSRLERREELFLAAPTGIAAVLIGGQTLHSLVMMCPNERASVDKTRLTANFRYASTIVVDEVSMIDARFMNAFSQRLRLSKGEDLSVAGRPFGGLDVIFMGDFAQLKPPIEQSLYSYKIVSCPSFPEANIRGQQAMNGICLWRQVTNVVELVRNQRHAADPPYAQFLKRLRVGQCISRSHAQDSGLDDFQYLQPRLLSNLAKQPEVIKQFHDAPVIVGSKMLRDVLNAKLLVRHASRVKQKVNVYYSTDTSFGKPIKKSLRAKLWNLPASYCQDSLGCLPMFPGMKVMITENLAFDHQIVNGKEGTIRRIKYNVDGRGRRSATVVYVHIEGCGINLTGNDEDIDVAPIFPTSKSVRSKAVSRVSGLGSFRRNQMPFLPAYSYTDYKGQGRSLTTVMVDLFTARGQSAYVMLSRVRTLSGLAILRPFPESKITAKLSEELRAEITRLDRLNSATYASMEGILGGTSNA